MPKAILAIRTYPATLIVALLLFLATLVMTAASMGTAGVGGGDDGDGGSGIGGTGKSGEFGGSGFGGTGSPSPFITSVNDQESLTPSTASNSSPSEIELSQALTDSVEQRAIDIEPENIVLSDNSPDVGAPSRLVTDLLLQEKAPDVQLAKASAGFPEPSAAPEPVVDQPALPRFNEAGLFEKEVADEQLVVVQQDRFSGSSDIVAESLNTAAGAESVSVNLETAAKESEQEIDRNALPDRIQRPDLPPFQRVRPVDRASIVVPSRVQPMRI